MSILTLAVPILVEQLLRILMGTVNTFMLSRISDDASAAVGVANQLLNVVTMAAVIISAGSAVLVNQLLGAKKDKEAVQVTMNSISISVVIGLVISAICFFAGEPLIRALGLEEALLEDAVIYLKIVGISCTMQFASSMIAVQFRSRNLAVIPMLVIIFNNLVNIGGGYLVISGIAPMQGVSGIASVRLLSETLGLILLTYLFVRRPWGQQARDLIFLNWVNVKEFLRVGLGSGMESISYNTSQLITTGFVTSFSAAVLSAKVYTQSVNTYTYLAGLSIGSAAQIISGHMIGAGKEEEAYRFIRKTWLAVLALNLVFSIAFFGFSGKIIGMFTDSQEIIAIARTLFLVDIFTCTGRSMNHSFNFGLRSAGYVLLPMIIAVISIWSIQVGGGFIFTKVLSMGVVGLWIAQCLDEWLRGIMCAILWHKKKWMRTSK